MKLLIAADIHGSLYNFEKLLERIEIENPTKVIFLGDLYYHGPRNPLPEGYAPMEISKLINSFSRPLVLIKGNCDSEVDQMITERRFIAGKTFSAFGKKIFITHGHKFNSNFPTKSRVDIVIHGHTHICKAEKKDGVLYLNIGSISLPKEDSPKCYLILEDGQAIFKTLDGVIFLNETLQD